MICPWGGYCPEKFTDYVNLSVELKASYIRDISLVWKSEQLLPNQFAFTKLAVGNINAAYDCAVVQRPIIGASLCEQISNDVNNVTIPVDVISAFISEITSASDIARYLSGGSPKTGINFDFGHISYNYTDGSICVDLNKLEGRMWYYYVATRYIGCGITALHMGWITKVMQNDATSYYTYETFNKIRAYAANNNTFVLLSAGPVTSALKYDGQMILDFFDGPTRPTPIGSYCNPSELVCALLDNPDVSDQLYPARVLGGNSPLMSGCTQDYTPYELEYDNTGGILDFGTTSEDPGCPNPIHQWWGAWGYDESRWYDQIISDSYRASVMSEFMCSLRKTVETDHRGYICLPGILIMGYPENIYSGKVPAGYAYTGTVDPLNLGPTDSKFKYGGYWGMIESDVDPVIKNTAVSLLTPTPDNQLGFHLSSFALNESGACGFLSCNYNLTYGFSVNNPDCSSVYTWYIPGQQTQYGPSINFHPPATGSYTIYLRQDNLANTPSWALYTFNGKLTANLCFGGFCFRSEDSTQGPTNSIKTKIDENNLDVYPNPTSGSFSVIFQPSSNSNYTFLIKNILNQTVKVLAKDISIKSDNRYNSTFNISDLPQGIYVIQVIDNTGKFEINKIVKM